MYFSFTTLTTLGYDDVAPTNTVARIWATLEGVTDTLYLTILVARLVAIYSREHAVQTDVRDG
jgi:voltage-gated potassium channel